jgi:hypothetical protein
MLANFVKRSAIAALLIAIFVSTSPKIGLLLCGIVCFGAWIACGEAFRSKEYGWSSSFLIVALVFSTLFLATLPQIYAFILNFLCLGLFISSVVHSRELLTSQATAKIEP